MITRRSAGSVVTHKCRGGSLTKKLLLQFSWLKTKLEQLNRYRKRASNILLKKMQGTHKDKSKRIQFYCPSEPSELEQIVFSVKQKLLYPLVLKDNDSRTKLRRHIRNGTELRQVLHRLPMKHTPQKGSKVFPDSPVELDHKCKEDDLICVNDGVRFDLKDDNQGLKNVLGFVESMMHVNDKSVQDVTLKDDSKCTVTYEDSTTDYDVNRSEVMCTVKHVNSLISVIPLDTITAKLSNDFKQRDVQQSHVLDKKYELQEWSPPILLGVGHVFSYSGRHIRMDMEFDWKNLFCHFYGITNYLIRFNKDIRKKQSRTELKKEKHTEDSTPICIVVPPKGHNSILSIVNKVSLESTVRNKHRLVLAQNQDVSIVNKGREGQQLALAAAPQTCSSTGIGTGSASTSASGAAAARTAAAEPSEAAEAAPAAAGVGRPDSVNKVSLESTVRNKHRLVLAQNQDVSIAHCRNGQVVSVELFVNRGKDKLNELDDLWELLHRLLSQENESLSFDYDTHADIPTYSLYDAICRDIQMNIQDEDDFNIKFKIAVTKDASNLLQEVSNELNRTIYVYSCVDDTLTCKSIKPTGTTDSTPIYLVVVQHNHKLLYHRLKCNDSNYSPSKAEPVSSTPLSTMNPNKHPLDVLENIIKDNHMWCISFHNILLAYNFLSIEPRTAWWNKTSKDRYAKLKLKEPKPEIILQFGHNEMKNYLFFGKCKYLPFGYIEVVYHRDQRKENTNTDVVVVTTKASFYEPFIPNKTEIKEYNRTYEPPSSGAKGIPFGRFKFSDFKSRAVQSYAKTGFAVNGDDGIYASIKLQDNAMVTLCSLGQFRIVTLHPGESRRFDMKYVVAFNENCQLQWMRKYKNNGAQRVSLGIDFLISNVQFTNVHPTLDTHVICQTTESPHWGYLKWRITQALTLGAAGGGLFALGAVPMSLKFIQMTTGMSLGS